MQFSVQRRLVCFSALIILILTTVAVLIGCGASSDSDRQIAASDNRQRLAYLSSLGWEVTEEPVETLQLQLPKDLSKDYGDYCKLQKGYPFARYGGKQVTRYTYIVTNYPDLPQGVQANLYVCKDKIIGGDIIATGTDGFQQGLAYPK